MSQIEKNTVSAKNQLKKNENISFINLQNDGIRVMFVGNSITLHGKCPSIGWEGHWGMAASCAENDYVHQLIKMIEEKIDSNASFCICQASEWETNYTDDTIIAERYHEAKDFNADIVIMRIIENVPMDGFDEAIFENQYKRFIEYLGNGKAKIIVTDGFWSHIGDKIIKKVAVDNNYPFVELGDLGEDDDMKAIGEYWHDGVCAHPNDKGMKNIATRIFEKIY